MSGCNVYDDFINRKLSIIIIVFYISIQLAYSAITFTNWQNGSPNLPAAIDRGATAFNNQENSIHLVGGTPAPHQEMFTTYHIDFNTFTQSSTTFFSAFPEGIFTQGQSFVQNGSVLYMTQNEDDPGDTIFSWNILTNATNNDAFPDVAQEVSDQSCMALYQEYMIIIEGSTNEVQILNVDTNEWLTSVPQLNQPDRRWLSCAVANNELYAIAGDTDPEPSIEYLDLSYITNIQNSQWVVFPHIVPGLPGSSIYEEHRTVVHCEQIVIIGGMTKCGRSCTTIFNTDIFLLDPVSKTIMNVGDMNIGRSSPYVAITESTLYVFGGRTSSGRVATWEYHSLPPCPTTMPTTMPTTTPTTITKTPTAMTTMPSTMTTMPTAMTTMPSTTPTTATQNPSKSPTDSNDDSSINSISSDDDSEENFNAISSRNEQMDSLNKKEQNNDGMNDKHKSIDLTVTVSDYTWINVYLLFGVMVIVSVVVICRMYFKNRNKNKSPMSELQYL